MYYTPGGAQLSHMLTVDLARALLPPASAEWVQEQVSPRSGHQDCLHAQDQCEVTECL